MYSVNVPVPGRVRELAAGLYPSLQPFDDVRAEHTLLCKRLGSAEGVDRLQRRTHRALGGLPAVEARITGIEYFAEPPRGVAPVVYLAVESPGLEAIHERLVESFGAIDGLEGDDYVPHVTLARGGELAAARALAAESIDPIEWTIGELEFWDATYELPVSRVALPS